MEIQRYMRFKTDIGLVSNNTSKNQVEYDAKLSYQYFFSLTKDKQHKVNVDANLNKLVKNNRYGLDFGLIYNNNTLDTLVYDEVFLNLNPYYKRNTKQWQIQIGANTCGEFGGDSVIYHLYPNILIQNNISNTIIPYVSFKGYIQNNNFEFVNTVNPFINRFNNYQVTNYAQVIDLGFKGNISKNMYFHLNGNYSKIDNMGFFINDTSLDLNNKFVLEYTNVERFAGYGEFALRDLGKFSFTLKGHYYYYSYLKNHQKPWQMPNVDVCLTTDYQFSEQLNFGVNVDFIGTRYAKEFGTTGQIIEKKLNPIIDVSLFAEYKFASNFNCFIYLNNVTGQKQYVWNNYMSQGFNVLAGLKYSF